MRLTFAGLSDVGRVREENQDRWFADSAEGLFIVADGMGGNAAGSVASRIVVNVLPQLVRRSLHDTQKLTESTIATRARDAIRELSERLHQESEHKPAVSGMGSALVMVLVLDKRALIAHLGDCRGYLLNNGQLQQLTKDHTLTQLLVDCGEITTEEALVHPGRHQLTQFVGISTESLPVTRIVPLSPGDRLLLCSDGVSGILSREQILESLQNGKSPEEACRFLVAAANEAGGDDNATAVVIDVGDAE